METASERAGPARMPASEEDVHLKRFRQLQEHVIAVAHLEDMVAKQKGASAKSKPETGQLCALIDALPSPVPKPLRRPDANVRILEPRSLGVRRHAGMSRRSGTDRTWLLTAIEKSGARSSAVAKARGTNLSAGAGMNGRSHGSDDEEVDDYEAADALLGLSPQLTPQLSPEMMPPTPLLNEILSPCVEQLNTPDLRLASLFIPATPSTSSMLDNTPKTGVGLDPHSAASTPSSILADIWKICNEAAAKTVVADGWQSR